MGGDISLLTGLEVTRSQFARCGVPSLSGLGVWVGRDLPWPSQLRAPADSFTSEISLSVTAAGETIYFLTIRLFSTSLLGIVYYGLPSTLLEEVNFLQGGNCSVWRVGRVYQTVHL